MSLTDLECRNAKPQDKSYKLTDGQGLYLYIMPSGGKSWRYKFRFLNKEKCLVIGQYPTISLAEARERQNQARKELANGVNPAVAKQEAGSKTRCHFKRRDHLRIGRQRVA